MNKPRALGIRTLTPILIGTGVPGALDVDAAMQVDQLGLPVLERRQLVARLRDAANQVKRAFRDEEPELGLIIDHLFGAAGQVGTGRALHLGDALLPTDAQRAAWNRLHEVDPNERAAARNSNTAQYTFEESQTSVDDDSAPRTGSLRSARMGVSGLEFTAALEWDREPTQDEVTVLARMCLALQQMGGGESRGLGQVEVSLDADHPLTAELAARHLNGLRAGTSSVEASVPQGGDGTQLSRYLTLSLTQRAPIALGLVSSVSHGEISGSTLRGAVFRAVRSDPARRVLLIESGIVRFGPAFLRKKSGRLVAPPLDIVTIEDDFGELSPRDVLHAQLSATDEFEWFRSPVTLEGDRFVRVPIEPVQRLNRQQQLYFESATLPAGHAFEAELELVGTAYQIAAAHDALIEIAATRILRVGGNAEAFGGDLQVEVEHYLREESNFTPEYGLERDKDAAYRLAVVLVSPALVRDPSTGDFAPGALPEVTAAQWRAALGDEWTVTIDGHAVHRVSVGGFNQLYDGLRPEHPAAAAGSVVHLVIEPVDPGTTRSPALPTGRLGERGVDGFGLWHLRQYLPESIESGELLHDLHVREHPTIELHDPHEVAGPRYSTEPDPGAATDIVVLDFTLTLLTDTAFGDGDRTAQPPADEIDDPEKGQANRLALYRDTEGDPTLRATTMAGVVRHYLRRRLGVLPEDPDPAEVTALLGFTRPDGASAQSRVRFTSHRAIGPSGMAATDFRAHNRVSPESGTVADQALYFREVLPAGTYFACRWQVELPSDRNEARGLLATLLAAANGFEHSARDGIRLGARTGKGYGLVRARNWSVSAFDTTTPEGFLAFYGPRRREPQVVGDGHPDLLAAFQAAVPKLADGLEPPKSVADVLVLDLTFVVGERWDGQIRPSTLRHGSGRKRPRAIANTDMDQEQAPEVSLMLRRPVLTDAAMEERPLDPGSGWHAALKRAAFQVAYARAGGTPDEARARATTQVEQLFGALDAKAGPGGQPRPSRVRVTEREISSGRELEITRNRLDPLTQGTVTGALFTEQVIYGGQTEVTVTVSRPTRDDLGLVWLVLRDFRDGLASPMGADVSIGHGRRILAAISLGAEGRVDPAAASAFEDLLNPANDPEVFQSLLTVNGGEDR